MNIHTETYPNGELQGTLRPVVSVRHRRPRPQPHRRRSARRRFDRHSHNGDPEPGTDTDDHAGSDTGPDGRSEEHRRQPEGSEAGNGVSTSWCGDGDGLRHLGAERTRQLRERRSTTSTGSTGPTARSTRPGTHRSTRQPAVRSATNTAATRAGRICLTFRFRSDTPTSKRCRTARYIATKTTSATRSSGTTTAATTTTAAQARTTT